MERVIALKPDLIVVWLHGNAERQTEQLRQLGIPLFYSEPRQLDDIAGSIQRIGRLLGTDQTAQAAAAELRQKLAKLRAQYQNRPPVRTFYQVWDKPLYTLNGQHIVSDAMRVCGGENIFAGMTVTAPNVSIEAVLQQDPEAILSGDQRNQSSGGVNLWQPYTHDDRGAPRQPVLARRRPAQPLRPAHDRRRGRAVRKTRTGAPTPKDQMKA